MGFYPHYQPHDVEISVGTEAANVVAVTIQCKDVQGSADLAVRGVIFAYISDDANGDSIAATAPDGGWAIGTDGLLIPVVANKAAFLVSESDGDIDLEVTESGTDTFYIACVMPRGNIVMSDALSFTA